MYCKIKVTGQTWVGWSTPVIITFGSKGGGRTESSRLLGNAGERRKGRREKIHRKQRGTFLL